MQDVNPPAQRAADTGREVGRGSDVAGLAEVSDPVSAGAPDRLTGIIERRCIVDDLDLHQVRPGILGQHALQGGAKKGGAVVTGDHDRPERPVLARDLIDRRHRLWAEAPRLQGLHVCSASPAWRPSRMESAIP